MKKKLKVLIACEYSGRTRNAFIKKGHNAISCDILPTKKPGPHYQGNVLDILDDGFDLMIAHPPCTYLTCSAEWAYKNNQTKNIKPGILIGDERKEAREGAIKFFMKLVNADIKMIAIENPVGVMSTRFRKPDQYIQPYEYGHNASKRTGIWLKNLPLLIPTKFVEPRMVCCGEVITGSVCSHCFGKNTPLPRWKNQTNSGQNVLPPSKNRGKKRGKTYKGWSKAMAKQWGKK